MNRFFSSLFKSKRNQIGLLSTLVIITAIGFLNQVEVPHPWIYSPESSGSKIQSVPENRRWMVTHLYGALSAQTIDIDEFRPRANALPDGLEYAYYDGAAHHLACTGARRLWLRLTFSSETCLSHWTVPQLRSRLASHGAKPDLP